MCRKRPTKQFSALRRSCQARIGLFICRTRSREQLSVLLWSCEARMLLFMAGEERESSCHFYGVPVKLV